MEQNQVDRVRALIRPLIEADQRLKTGSIRVFDAGYPWTTLEIKIKPKKGSWEELPARPPLKITHTAINTLLAGHSVRLENVDLKLFGEQEESPPEPEFKDELSLREKEVIEKNQTITRLEELLAEKNCRNNELQERISSLQVTESAKSQEARDLEAKLDAVRFELQATKLEFRPYRESTLENGEKTVDRDIGIANLRSVADKNQNILEISGELTAANHKIKEQGDKIDQLLAKKVEAEEWEEVAESRQTALNTLVLQINDSKLEAQHELSKMAQELIEANAVATARAEELEKQTNRAINAEEKLKERDSDFRESANGIWPIYPDDTTNLVCPTCDQSNKVPTIPWPGMLVDRNGHKELRCLSCNRYLATWEGKRWRTLMPNFTRIPEGGDDLISPLVDLAQAIDKIRKEPSPSGDVLRDAITDMVASWDKLDQKRLFELAFTENEEPKVPEELSVPTLSDHVESLNELVAEHEMKLHDFDDYRKIAKLVELLANNQRSMLAAMGSVHCLGPTRTAKTLLEPESTKTRRAYLETALDDLEEES